MPEEFSPMHQKINDHILSFLERSPRAEIKIDLNSQSCKTSNSLSATSTASCKQPTEQVYWSRKGV